MMKKFEQIQVYRVQFGNPLRSHESILFAVRKDSELKPAINEYCKLMIKIGARIIDYNYVKIENFNPEMTPCLFNPTD